MTDLQSRLDTAFGTLRSREQSTVPEWRPNMMYVFRAGVDSGEDSSEDEEAEREERRRREVMPGMPMDFAEEDVPDASGQLPSRSFCRQMDVEDEFDDVDALALQLEEAYDQRPNLQTQVLKNNYYDIKYLQSTLVDTTINGRDGRLIDQGLSSEDDNTMDMAPSTSAGLTSAYGRASSNAGAPGSTHRPLLKSALRRKPASPAKKKKRVSFSENIRKSFPPWMPPHKRSGYNVPVLNKESVSGEGDYSAEIIPNPGIKHGFTRYDLEEPLIVGGGIGQLSHGDQCNEQPVVQPSAEERWQGKVGESSVKFARQPKRKDGELEEERQKKEASPGLMPSLLTFMDGQSDDDEMSN